MALLNRDADKTENNIKVLLVTPISDLSFMNLTCAPPIGLYRLRNYLISKGIYCDILDLDLDRTLENKYLRLVEQGVYDVIGVSVSHQNMLSDLKTLWRFREASRKSGKRCVFISGGQEASLNYTQWLEAGIDLIFLGYPEKRLYEFISRLDRQRDDDIGEIVREIPGVAYKEKDEHFIFRPANILTPKEFKELSFDNVKNLDIPFDDYWAAVRKSADNLDFHGNIFIVETVRLYTSSHCAHNCGFCTSQVFLPVCQNKKFPVIMLSASEVYELVLHHIRRYGAKGFLFCDDDFLVGNKGGLDRAVEFCRLIVEAKNNGLIPEDTTFNCQARISDFLIRDSSQKKLNLELMNALHQAGFHGIGVGVETFSDSLLKCLSVNKIGVTETDCYNVLDALLQKKLVPTMNIIIGIPESTCDDVIHSMQMAVKYLLKGCQVAVTIVLFSFPGAPIYNSNAYDFSTIEWVNPETNKVLIIKDHVIPNEPKIANILEKIQDASAEELRKFNMQLEDSAIPKPLQGLAIFISVAKLLGRQDVAEEFIEVAHNIIKEEELKIG